MAPYSYEIASSVSVRMQGPLFTTLWTRCPRSWN